MLRKIRIFVSLSFFTLITLYFIDFAGFMPDEFHVLEHLQLIPALLGLHLGVLLFLLLITLLFGRVYCSSICPKIGRAHV